MRPLLAAVPPRTNPFFTLRAREEPALPFVWHVHAEHELTLIRQSSGLRHVGDGVEVYGPGDLVLVGPHVPHTWSSAEDPGGTACIVLHFRPAAVLPSAGGPDPALAPLHALFERARSGLAFDAATAAGVEPLLVRATRARPVAQVGLVLEALDILSASGGARALSGRRYGPGDPFLPLPPAVERACALIEERFREPLTLADVLAVVAKSESAFTRLFRRATGKSFFQYLTDARIAHACGLLVDDALSVAEVAARSGFPSVTFFNRVFRRKKGVAPSRYRAALRGAGRPALTGGARAETGGS